MYACTREIGSAILAEVYKWENQHFLLKTHLYLTAICELTMGDTP